MIEKKAFFFDFDNTLYSHASKCVPASAKLALKELRDKGHVIVLATGRGLESLSFIHRESEFEYDSYILLNGQQVFWRGALVYEQHATVSANAQLVQNANEAGIAIGGWTDNGVVVNMMNHHVQQVIDDFGDFHPQLEREFPDSFPIYMLHLYASLDELALFDGMLGDFICNRSHDYLINMIPKQAGKAIGVEKILEKEGLSVADAIAFGDGYNDIDMLQSVGFSVAMGDGSEELKKIASFIAQPPDEDGIIEAIRANKFLK